MTAQQEASWRERALNSEEQLRKLRQELATQRRLSDLMGQLKEPGWTWIQHDLHRLRQENDIRRTEPGFCEWDELQRRLDGARANVSVSS